MCGIASFCNNRIDRRALIHAMTDRMRHRGPDAEGFWLDDQSGWTLGHRRLSILDLSPSGAQPMISASGRTVLSYNGEIYNAAELRDALLQDGHAEKIPRPLRHGDPAGGRRSLGAGENSEAEQGHVCPRGIRPGGEDPAPGPRPRRGKAAVLRDGKG